MRRLAFAALVVAMTIAALLFGSHRQGTVASLSVAQAPAHRQPASPPGTPSLRRAAHRFARAFLAYEAGGTDRATRTAIRRVAVHRLARALLAHRPRPSDHPGARILALHVIRLPHRPGLALATGTARRPDGPEPFAFLLARRGGRWPAIAPAE